MRLTGELVICIGTAFAVAQIHEIEQRVATSEAARELLNLRWRSDDSGPDVGIGEAFHAGVDANHDLDVGVAINNVGGSPLGDRVM